MIRDEGDSSLFFGEFMIQKLGSVMGIDKEKSQLATARRTASPAEKRCDAKAATMHPGPSESAASSSMSKRSTG
jgi:hypothetical protein